MYVVAITGGIGSGKTTIANQFAALGIEVVDADLIAREVVAPGTPALAAITSHFGPEILTEQGLLDRRVLRERIFSDQAAKSWLNALLHPIIRSEMLRQCAAVSSPYCLLVVRRLSLWKELRTKTSKNPKTGERSQLLLWDKPKFLR